MRLSDIERARNLGARRKVLQDQIAQIEGGAGIVIKISGEYAHSDVVMAAVDPILATLRGHRQKVDDDLALLGVEPNA